MGSPCNPLCSYFSLTTLISYLPYAFLTEAYLYLKKQGINAINKISMPYEKVPNIKAHFSQMIDLPQSNNYWWEISYLNGCSICYYNPSSKIIIDNLNQI